MTAGDAFGEAPQWKAYPHHCCLDGIILMALNHELGGTGARKKAPYGALGNIWQWINASKSVTPRQNLFREDEFFVRLVCRSHPGPQPLVEKDVFCVEGFELWILSSADFL